MNESTQKAKIVPDLQPQTAGLQISDLHIRFGDNLAVQNLSLQAASGDFVALVGESGSGKSVTALSLGGLLPATATIRCQKACIEDFNTLNCSRQGMKKALGDHFSYIFQEPMTSLNPVLRVRTQMLEQIDAHRSWPKEKSIKRCLQLLREVQITDAERVFDAYPHQLSGGLRQRVMIAMALLLDPVLLIADEPTTALDVTVQKEIMELLRTLQRSNNTTVLFITHDLDLVEAYADKVHVMYAGTIVEEGLVAEVLQKPGHPYTRGLLACTPNRQVRGQKLKYIPGRVQQVTSADKGCPFAPRCPIADSRCHQEMPLPDTTFATHPACFKAHTMIPTDSWSQKVSI